MAGVLHQSPQTFDIGSVRKNILENGCCPVFLSNPTSGRRKISTFLMYKFVGGGREMIIKAKP